MPVDQWPGQRQLEPLITRRCDSHHSIDVHTRPNVLSTLATGTDPVVGC